MKEMKELEDRGIPVRERLLLSEACPLILDYHVALDNAREKARGAKAIGTTGRGIGPAYEDKVARRGLRVGDLFDKETFAEKLKEVMEYHNFQLVNYYKAEAVDYQKVLDDTMAVADILTSMVVDVSDLLDPGASAWRFRHVRRCSGYAAGYRPRYLSVRNIFQHHCWWRGDRFRHGPALC